MLIPLHNGSDYQMDNISALVRLVKCGIPAQNKGGVIRWDWIFTSVVQITQSGFTKSTNTKKLDL
jgi:hypothetical protein